MRGHRDTQSDKADAPVKTEAEPGEAAAAEDTTGSHEEAPGAGLSPSLSGGSGALPAPRFQTCGPQS